MLNFALRGSQALGRLCTRGYGSLPSKKVILNNDMVICWHPEAPFPYECSKPLPQPKPKQETILKLELKEADKVFHRMRKEAVIQQLAKITYTCKNRWYPRSRDKKAKKMEPDRPYL